MSRKIEFVRGVFQTSSSKARWLAAVLLVGACLWASSAQAATLTWDGTGSGGTGDGAGVWDTASKWWNLSSDTTWTSGSDAVFGHGGAGGAVTLANSTTANTLTFNSFSGTYTLGTVGKTITLNSGLTMNSGAGAVTISSNVTLAGPQTWQNNSANLVQIGGSTGTTLDNGGNALTFQNGRFQIPGTSDVFQGAGATTVDNAQLNLYGMAPTPISIT